MDHVNDDWTMSSLPFPPHRSVSHTAVHGGLQSAAPAKDKSNKSNKHKHTHERNTDSGCRAPGHVGARGQERVHAAACSDSGPGPQLCTAPLAHLANRVLRRGVRGPPTPTPLRRPSHAPPKTASFGKYGIGGIAPIGTILGSAA